MVRYSFLALLILIAIASVMSAPASNEDPVEIEAPSSDVDDIQGGSKKTKRGIYGGGYGYGFGHYPYYSYYPYGHYGHGYGYYPYYSVGYHGYGHYGHGYGGHGFW